MPLLLLGIYRYNRYISARVCIYIYIGERERERERERDRELRTDMNTDRKNRKQFELGLGRPLGLISRMAGFCTC